MVMNDHMSKKIMERICVTFLQLRPFKLNQRWMQALYLALFKQVKLLETLLAYVLTNSYAKCVPGEYPYFHILIVFKNESSFVNICLINSTASFFSRVVQSFLEVADTNMLIERQFHSI